MRVSFYLWKSLAHESMEASLRLDGKKKEVFVMSTNYSGSTVFGLVKIRRGIRC